MALEHPERNILTLAPADILEHTQPHLNMGGSVTGIDCICSICTRLNRAGNEIGGAILGLFGGQHPARLGKPDANVKAACVGRHSNACFDRLRDFT
ncbi:MAG: hypothetical protein RLZZ366_2476 [Pseudomonadota bacterium]